MLCISHLSAELRDSLILGVITFFFFIFHFYFNSLASTHLTFFYVFWFIELNSFCALIICNNNLSFCVAPWSRPDRPSPSAFSLGVLKQMKRKLTVRVATRRRSGQQRARRILEQEGLCSWNPEREEWNERGEETFIVLLRLSLTQEKKAKMLMMMIVDSFFSPLFFSPPFFFFNFNFLLWLLIVHRFAQQNEEKKKSETTSSISFLHVLESVSW